MQFARFVPSIARFFRAAFSTFVLSRFIRIAATPENEFEFVRVFHSAAAIVVQFYFYSAFMRAKLKNGFFAVNRK